MEHVSGLGLWGAGEPRFSDRPQREGNVEERQMGIVEWLHTKIEMLERELRELYAIQALLERNALFEWPGEVALDEVRVGGKTIAKVVKGNNYVRVILAEPLQLSPEVKEYLSAVEEELRRGQRGDKVGAKEARKRAEEKRKEISTRVAEIEKKLKEEELARLTIREDDMEIRYDNVYTAAERWEVEEALKEAVRLNYLLKLLEHNEQPPEQEEEQGEDSNGKP